MKKILLFLVVFFAVINVSAQGQVVFYKKTAKRTYFRVFREGLETVYYVTFNMADGKINPRFTRETEYYKKGYDKIDAIENILNRESDDVYNVHRSIPEEIHTSINDETFQKANVQFVDSKDISAKPIKKITTSSKLKVGNYYHLFEVTRSQDESLIGCNVICQVIESRKSNISGSEGRLILRPICVEKQNGTQVRLQQIDIQCRGLNRTNVKTWMSFLLIPAFFPGTGAKILQNESIKLRLE